MAVVTSKSRNLQLSIFLFQVPEPAQTLTGLSLSQQPLGSLGGGPGDLCVAQRFLPQKAREASPLPWDGVGMEEQKKICKGLIPEVQVS